MRSSRTGRVRNGAGATTVEDLEFVVDSTEQFGQATLTLGARGRQLLAAAALEQGALGLLATLLGAGAAALTGWLLARQVFELDYQPDPLPWLLGIGGATMGIALAGWLATWPLVKRPPLESLRRGD